MRRRLLIIFLLVAAFSNATAAAAVGDAAGERLTAEEGREANALARRFARRMAETNDVAQVIPELFVPDFFDRQLQAPDNEPFVFIERRLARRLTRDELRRYYVGNINFRHLNDLYVYSKFPTDGVPEVGRVYPPEVARLLGIVDADFEKIEEADGDDDAPAEDAQTLALLRASLDALEEVNRLLSAEVGRRGAARSALYRKAVAEWDERHRLFEPWADACDEGCYGLPGGARLIIVNVPSFQLKIMPDAGGAKIVSAVPYFD